MPDTNSTKSSQPKPSKKPNTSTAHPKATKTTPIAKRARTLTSATSAADSVTDIVVVNDSGDSDDALGSDEDIEPEKDPEAILGTYSLVFS